jgi:RNA polymerase sigma-70 factor (ECF subfamily)
VFRYCLARTGVSQDAEDLVSEVFLRAMEALPRYDERGVPFLAFLYRVARNATIDRARRHRNDVSVESLVIHPASSHDVERETLRSLQRRALFTALSQLKAEYREVLLLRFVEGYAAAEAARLLGKTEMAVRNLQHRGLERLRRELSKAGASELFGEATA